MRRASLVVVLIIFSFFAFSCQEMSPIETDGSQTIPDIQSLAKKDTDELITKSGSGLSYMLSNDYLVEFTGSPDALDLEVGLLGGTVEKVFSQIGIAKVNGLDDNQAGKLAKLKGVKAVARDMIVQWIQPEKDVFENHIGENEAYFAYQWALVVFGMYTRI